MLPQGRVSSLKGKKSSIHDAQEHAGMGPVVMNPAASSAAAVAAKAPTARREPVSKLYFKVVSLPRFWDQSHIQIVNDVPATAESSVSSNGSKVVQFAQKQSHENLEVQQTIE